jgi:SEC-C motif
MMRADHRWLPFSISVDKLAANEVSYSWDALIEAFSTHVLAGTQYYTTHPGYENLSNQEKIFRFLAREPRTRRRLLVRGLLEAIRDTPKTMRFTRVMMPSKPGDPYYVFLLLPHLPSVTYEEYREGRLKFLEACCMVAKLKFPKAEDIVGIATESGRGVKGTEDILYYDARMWTEEDAAEARSLHRDLNLLTEVTKVEGTEKEYPVSRPSLRHYPPDFTPQASGFPRKQPCPCGSGKKYKRCCGDERYQRKSQRKVGA